MTMITINIAADFSPNPGGRFPTDGPSNGEKFREKFLKPALQSKDQVTVVLDGVNGFGSSFLEESFGGLIRKGIIDKESAKTRLQIKCSDDDQELKFYKEMIWFFINDAVRE